MNFSVRAVLCGLTLAVLGYSANALGATPAQNLKLTFTDPALGGYTMPYNLFLPANYDPAGPELPVIMFLHGAGERGDNNTSQVGWIQNAVNATQGASSPYRAIILAPQCPTGQVWNSKNNGDNWQPGGAGNSSYSETPAQQASRPISNALQAAMHILSNVEATQAVNSNKLYVTGLSMGGFGSWEAITRFPGKFAAAMPLSGGANTLAASTLLNQPIWAFHGTADTVVYPNGTTNLVNAIRTAGGTKSVESIVSGMGHSGWDGFYATNTYKIGDASTSGGSPNGANVYDWLFAQSLAVPEPATMTILLIGSISLLGRRRKQA